MRAALLHPGLSSAIFLAALFCLIFSAIPAMADTPVHTAPLNLDPAVRDAYQHFYELDYDGALARFQKILAAHSDDPIAVNYVLDVTLFRELYRQDLLDTTLYAHDGFITGKHAVEVDPKVRSQVEQLSERAILLSEERLQKNEKDIDALYARGVARSFRATYIGLILKSYLSALKLALAARSDHEKVLELDADYIDAKLVVGIHEYVAGSLPLAFRMMAGLMGVAGSKRRGLELLGDCGRRGIATSVEARTALALFLRHDSQYEAAIAVARSLKQQYPHDFLFWLEEANLLKDSGDGEVALAAYKSVIAQAAKPGYFPSYHLELAWFGMAEVLRGRQDFSGAAAAYEQAAHQPTTTGDLKRRAESNAAQVRVLTQQQGKG